MNEDFSQPDEPRAEPRPAFEPNNPGPMGSPVTGGGGGFKNERDGRRVGRGEGRRDREILPKTSQQGMFDKQPPVSTEAEMSLLGSMLLDHNVIGDVIQTVRTPEQFFHEKHGAIYQALVDVYDRHRSGDLVQIVQHLRDGGLLDQIGGEAYLLRLAEGVPTSVNAPHYARIVAEKARLRRLIDAAGFILHEAYHVGTGPDESKLVLDRAETAIFDVAKEDEVRASSKLADLLDAELARLEAAEGKGYSGLKTGFHELDKMTSGLQKDELIIVAARPSMGKTALALNLAEQIAFGGRTPEQGGVAGRDFDAVPVGIFSLEMSREALVQRLLSARSGIDQSKLRSGDLTDAEWNTLNTAAGQLYEAPIFLDDTPGLTLLGLRAKARRMHGQFGVRCLVIDYLQLLSAPGAARESRQNEVGAISRGIKALARELSIPIICLAQLNRGAEERRRPRMSDLRESGSIEQDADVVALLHREDYYHQGDEEWLAENEDQVGVAELILDKQRNGPTGVIKLSWSRETTRFKNHEGGGDYGGGGNGGYGGGNSYGTAAGHVQPASPKGGNAGTMGGHGAGNGGGYDGFGTPPIGSGYASPSDAAERFPEVNVPKRQGFAPGHKTGPIENHRDGGGPDDEFDDDEIAPF